MSKVTRNIGGTRGWRGRSRDVIFNEVLVESSAVLLRRRELAPADRHAKCYSVLKTWDPFADFWEKLSIGVF